MINENEVGNIWVLWEKLGLAIRPDGYPHNNSANVIRILEKWPPLFNLVWLDPVNKRILTRGSNGVAREWTHIDNLRLAIRLQGELQLHHMSSGRVFQAVRVYTHEQALRNDCWASPQQQRIPSIVLSPMSFV